jgi:hypothetical protein
MVVTNGQSTIELNRPPDRAVVVALRDYESSMMPRFNAIVTA